MRTRGLKGRRRSDETVSVGTQNSAPVIGSDGMTYPRDYLYFVPSALAPVSSLEQVYQKLASRRVQPWFHPDF